REQARILAFRADAIEPPLDGRRARDEQRLGGDDQQHERGDAELATRAHGAFAFTSGSGSTAKSRTDGSEQGTSRSHAGARPTALNAAAKLSSRFAPSSSPSIVSASSEKLGSPKIATCVMPRARISGSASLVGARQRRV